MQIVVKVGTNVLTDETGKISNDRIEQIASGIFSMHRQDHQVILVSSGAIATGKSKLPQLEGEVKKQIWAAIGQPALMEIYAKHFAKLALSIGQCLLLRSDFTDRERYDNSLRTIKGLLEADVVPIINENDVVAMEDLTVGDNDLLSAMLAVALGADKLILLTNQTGIYTANPDTDPSATLIKTVNNVDRQFEKMFNRETSSLGRGGVLSKVRAAKHAVSGGVETIIADGRQAGILSSILTGGFIGTKFLARPVSATDQQRWIMAAKGFGEIVVDDGAAKALGSGKSLLFPGIVGTKGIFEKGQIVEVISRHGETVAYGKINYGFKDLQKALAKRKGDGRDESAFEKEIMHRDYMVRLKA